MFSLLKTYLYGPAAQFARSVGPAQSGRLLILDMFSGYSQSFSGNAEQIRKEIEKISFDLEDSPMASILSIEALFARLVEVQSARGAQLPDERELCLSVIRRLPSSVAFDDLKRTVVWTAFVLSGSTRRGKRRFASGKGRTRSVLGPY